MDFTPLLNLTPIQILLIWLGVYLFAAIANNMPAPTEKSGVTYRWLYGVLQTLGANAGRIARSFRAVKPPVAPPRESKR